MARVLVLCVCTHKVLHATEDVWNSPHSMHEKWMLHVFKSQKCIHSISGAVLHDITRLPHYKDKCLKKDTSTFRIMPIKYYDTINSAVLHIVDIGRYQLSISTKRDISVGTLTFGPGRIPRCTACMHAMQSLFLSRRGQHSTAWISDIATQKADLWLFLFSSSSFYFII